MLPWLVVISALLAGLFAYFVLGGPALESLPGLPIAAGVMLLLMLLYALSTRGHGDGWMKRWILPALIMSALGTGLYLTAPKIDLAALREASGLSRSNVEAGATDGFKSVRIRRSPLGQFIAQCEINGTAANMLIDSGSGSVILRHADAERAGIDTNALNYTVPIETANGQAHAAAVRLRSIGVGPIRLEGFEALVASPGSLNESLLGMTFLRRLRSYEISGDFITLRE